MAASSKPAPAEKPVRVKAKVDGYTDVISPAGFVTSVPDSVKDLLIDSGYTE